MIGQVIRELGIVETADNMVRWGPKQRKRSPRTHVLPMLIDMLGLITTAARGMISWLDQVYHAGKFFKTHPCG